MTMLCKTVLAVSVGFLLVCAGVFVALGAVPGLFGLGFWAVFLVVALAVERWRYKQILEGPPGPEWRANGEQFVDPETGRQVAVFEDPSGKRAYVGIRPPAPPAG